MRKWDGGVRIAVLLVLVFRTTNGGDRVNVRGMGMARASVALSRGLDAIGVNPANLAINGDEVMTMTILPVGASFGVDFLTYDVYSRYLRSGPALMDLPESDKQIILDSFQSPMGKSNAEAAARLFGITLRTDSTSSMAFCIDYGLIGAASIPRQYAQLLLFGNVPGSTFEIDGLAIQALWARTYSLSFGGMLPNPKFLSWLAGGISLKFVQGYGYYEVQQFSASLRTAADGLISGPVGWHSRSSSIDGVDDPLGDLFQNPAGYGFGIDVGLSGGVNDFLSFGVSITDLGRVKWTRDVEETTSDTIAVNEEPDVFKSVRTLRNAISGVRKETQPFSSTLPSLLRFGISVQVEKLAWYGGFPGELLIAAEYLSGIGANSLLGEQPRVSLGLEYKPTHWLPIRTGVSMGGSNVTQVALGVGLTFRWMDFDLGTDDLLAMFEGKNLSSASVGVGFRVRIHE